jgi:D-alanine-D-alanine ligase
MTAKKLQIALLAGGKSGERQVSLKGAAEVIKALNPDKYEVKQYDPAADLALLAADSEKLDAAFILLHGLFGEDGTMQGFLDLLGVPYQGSGVLGSAIAMDKDLSKILYKNYGLTVPDWIMLEKDAPQPPDIDDILQKIDLPLVVKPARQGSSLGMGIARTKEELAAAIQKAFQYDSEVMLEQYISGREITVGVLGNDTLTALPLVEIIPNEQYDFFDYEAKYQPGATREVCPAEFDEKLTARAQEYGLAAHRALRLRGYSRTDMIVTNDNIYILETNTIPGMTPTSLLPQAAAVAGLSFSALLDKLLDFAME